ncbi:hypothetical protein [Heyndrickxia coagulans]|nr:hypothetical protein [Heyndrickxia coagulans]
MMEDVGFYLYAPLTRQMSNEGLLNESDSSFHPIYQQALELFAKAVSIL